jgi:hypothetical protein
MQRRFLFVRAACLLAMVASCGSSAPPKRRFFVVMVDETQSFSRFWDRSLGFASAVVQRMKGDDAFMLIGIDGRGGDPEDVRVGMTTMDPNPIKAMAMRRQLAAQVKAIKVRTPDPKDPNKDYSDILGAVDTAASTARRHPDYRPVVLIFSDMVQTPKLPDAKETRKRGIAFPEGAEAHVFYFNAAELADIRKMKVDEAEKVLLQSWLDAFGAAKLKIAREDFVPAGDAEKSFNQLLPVTY